MQHFSMHKRFNKFRIGPTKELCALSNTESTATKKTLFLKYFKEVIKIRNIYIQGKGTNQFNNT